MHKILFSFLFVFITFAQPQKVKVGADVLIENKIEILSGKTIGVITNHTAILSNKNHLIDELAKIENIKIKFLFAPEHGIRGVASAGEKISNTIDEETGIPIVSLYGSLRKPTAEMLVGIDVLVFDIQDVGARFYTYLSTMILSMEAAAENKIKFIVLDRPNPIRGIKVDGPIRVDSLKSFVGQIPIPIMHAMTYGEIASMANEMGWLENKLKVDLEIIKIEGWRRAIWFDETILNWTSPSPNIKTINSAIVYPGTCLFEATNISEGRGTLNPFEIIGAPWLNSEELINNLIKLNLHGVMFKSIKFVPKENSGAKNPKYNFEECNGIFIEVTNRNIFEPITTAIAMLIEIQKLNPNEFKINESYFNKLIGNGLVVKEILKGNNYKKIVNGWQKEIKKFTIERKKYLIYND